MILTQTTENDRRCFIGSDLSFFEIGRLSESLHAGKTMGKLNIPGWIPRDPSYLMRITWNVELGHCKKSFRNQRNRGKLGYTD